MKTGLFCSLLYSLKQQENLTHYTHSTNNEQINTWVKRQFNNSYKLNIHELCTVATARGYGRCSCRGVQVGARGWSREHMACEDHQVQVAKPSSSEPVTLPGSCEKSLRCQFVHSCLLNGSFNFSKTKVILPTFFYYSKMWMYSIPTALGLQLLWWNIMTKATWRGEET